MTPRSEGGGANARLVTLGVLLGAAVGLVLGGPLVYVFGVSLSNQQRAGWNLEPIVVAAEDIVAGQAVTFEVINQRSMPEQFVSTSMVKPNSASYVVKAQAEVAMRAGEPLLWSTFEQGALSPQCLQAIEQAAKPDENDPQVSQLLASLRAAKRKLKR